MVWDRTDGARVEAPLKWYVLPNPPRPIVVRRFRRKGNSWRVEYQELDLTGPPKDGVYPIAPGVLLPMLLATAREEYQQARVVAEDGSEWRPTFRLPERQAPLFVGREAELPRACRLVRRSG